MAAAPKKRIDDNHLTNQARDRLNSLWHAPKASQGGPDCRDPRPGVGGVGNLKSQAAYFSLRGLAKSTFGQMCFKKALGSGLQLNPVFVAWLMGWPLIVPVGLGSLETEWCRYKQRMRSYLCGLLSELQPAAEVA
ncbi:MAG: hypothetical protein ABFC77_11065 [Thermoguttaceae bacterium]